MPTPTFSWPARTFDAWLGRTGYSLPDVAHLLGRYGVRVTPQAVGEWKAGKSNLSIGVVACLCRIDPAHADLWREDFLTASGADESDPVTEDHLPLEERVRRALRENSEGNVALVDLLDGADEVEIRRAMTQLRESIAESQRVLDQLSSMRRAS